MPSPNALDESGSHEPVVNTGLGGRMVLAGVFGALGLFTLLFFVGVWWFDARDRDSVDERVKTQAVEIEATWNQYVARLEKSGLTDVSNESADRARAEMTNARLFEENGEGVDAEEAYRTALREYSEAFDIEATNAVKHWNDEIVPKFQTTVAGRFPFNHKSQLNAEEEKLNELFSSSTGQLSPAWARIEALSNANVDGASVIVLTENQKYEIDRVLNLGATYFPYGAQCLDVDVLVTVELKGLSAVTIVNGPQTVHVNQQNPLKTVRCVVTVDSLKTILAVANGHSSGKLHTFSKPWGFWRLCQTGFSTRIRNTSASILSFEMMQSLERGYGIEQSQLEGGFTQTDSRFPDQETGFILTVKADKPDVPNPLHWATYTNLELPTLTR